MKKLFSLFLVISMLAALLVPFTVSAATNGKLWAYAPKADTAPTIDGEMDDVWASAPEYVLTNKHAASNESLDASKKDTSRISFRALHEDGMVYFLVEIVDDYLANNKDGTHWKNDSLMLFVSEDNNSTALGTNGKSYQPYAIVDHYDEPQLLTTRQSGGQLDADSIYMVNFVEGGETGEAYHAFIEIQMKPIHPEYVYTDTHISLDFQYNDADSTDVSANNRTMVWKWIHGSATKEQDNWGYLKFVESTHTIFNQGSEWRYLASETLPEDLPENWTTSAEATEGWDVAPAPFGTETARIPDSVGAWLNAFETESYFYAVKEFTLTADDMAALEDKALLTDIFYDESPVIYVNGIKVHEESGYVTLYENRKLVDKATDLLKEGKNTIAVSLHQTAGGYEFDMNLFGATGDTTKSSAQTTFEAIALADEDNYDLYYQTRTNADDPSLTDYRIVIVADLDWLNTLSTMESVVTFSAEGLDDVSLTDTPTTVYSRLIAPGTVYTAADGTVIFGWIVTGVPADYAAGEISATLNVA